MSDDNVVPLRGRIFRRRRRHQGATWTPTNSSALTEDGVWCPVHRKRHGYMSEALSIAYEKRSDGSGFKIMWVCKLTGNVIKEVDKDGTL